ncbi:MAG: hypothetical protein F4Z04_15985 [Acidobacteria bacterium]|nr:hypothetical protein [Acidobacteriota bacterium]
MSSKARVLGMGMMLTLAAVLLTSAMGAAQGGALQVTVTYQGSGGVGPNNAIWLSVWDTADIPPDGSVLPIGNARVVENGGTVTVTGLAASTVYLTALYDEQGGWTGRTAVPSGTPAGVYSPNAYGAPGPIAVVAGETVEVEFGFTDAFRMP